MRREADAAASRVRARVAGEAGFALLLAIGFVGYVLLAPIEAPASRMETPGTVVLGTDGVLLQRDTRQGVRIPVALAAVAPHMVQATLAAEDQRFFSHPGIDPLAMLRAATDPGSRSGASTITQQLARRLYLDGGPLPLRKAREALIALQLTANFGRDEVLEAYLNDVAYGRGAYGVEAAARVYFGVAAKDLDLAESAFLAGLPRLPRLGSMGDITRAIQRQRYVLDRLRDDGRVSALEAEQAAREPLRLLSELAPPTAPHFVTFALEELYALRPDLAGQRGLIIETTLDAGLQGEAERIVALRLAELRGRDASNAAVVILEPGTGRVLAMVGAADAAGPDGAINMALAPRQPGSALKPFLYALALERGYTLSTSLLDVPKTFDTPSGPYTPQNYDRSSNGPVSLRVALASSLNLPAVRTLEALGVDGFLEIAHRFGLTSLSTPESYGLSLALGAGDVRLLDMAVAYGAFAAEGNRVPPYAVSRVRDTHGRVVYERARAQPRRATSPEVAWLIGDALRDPDARVPGFGWGTPLEAAIPAAVKTGTTTEFRDNWAVGFTPHKVVAVWVGNSDNRPMGGVSGVSGAAPIWRDLIEIASKDDAAAVPPRPPALVRATVCSPTGLRPGPDCPSSRSEWFLPGTAPVATERYYARSADGSLLVDPPPAARAWALDAGLRLAAPGNPGVGVEILWPAPGSVIFLTPELARDDLLIRATAPGAAAITLTVDGVTAGTLDGPDAAFRWVATAGPHTLEAIARLPDGTSRSALSAYEVRTR